MPKAHRPSNVSASFVFLAALLAAGCSTSPVPGVCCVDAESCGRLGLTEDRPCPVGQACVDFQCGVPSCSTQGCGAEAPVCDVATDTCTGCVDSSDCSRFDDTVCEPQTGRCVECLEQADCGSATEPVCDEGSCRACRLDKECASGACGEDGACFPAAAIIYLRSDGVDAGMCTLDAPCKRIQYGASRTRAGREHIVMAAGLYDLGHDTEFIEPQTVLVKRIFIHGSGSTIRSSSDSGAISMRIESVIRDLEIIGNGTGLDVGTSGRTVLERLKVGGTNVRAIAMSGDVTMRDITVVGGGWGIQVRSAARLTLDGGAIKLSAVGILTYADSVVDISNLLIFGASTMALDLSASWGGTVSFTTVVDSGTDSGTGPRAVRCGTSGIAVRSSIIWAPGSTERPAIDGGCTLASTIVGPTAVPGATNVDPRFVDPAGRDYHLSIGSPARDAVDTGPARDFEGDPRPRGGRFDLGADEAQ
jgi:hypothetical protein